MTQVSTLTQSPERIDETTSALTTLDQHAPEISVVIPLLNEEESIPHLYRALTDAMEAYGRSYEVIVVDDGSRDRSFALLKEIAQKDPHFTVVQLRRNFGQTAAFAAGFAQAQGDVIITMDCDNTHPPRRSPTCSTPTTPSARATCASALPTRGSSGR